MSTGYLLCAAVLGLCVGSFLNVVIYRLPRRISLVRPRSQCPACHHPLAWRELVPVLSYLVLQGRCRSCQVPVSRSYPATEALTAVVFLVVCYKAGAVVVVLRLLVLSSVLIAAAAIDRQTGCIPDRLVATGAAAGGALALFEGGGVGSYALPVLVSAGALWLLRLGGKVLFERWGMGLGDVKLAAMMGLFLGWHTLWVFYLAVLIGGLTGLAGLVTGRLTRTTPLPFAPFVALATLLYSAGFSPAWLEGWL